jgi:hypothetical protein
VPFTPLNLSNLVRWHDASNRSTLWDDSARTTLVANDKDPVGAWDDLSGNGRHILQATATQRMSFWADQYLGFDAILSDNVDDNLFDAIYNEQAHETWWFAADLQREGSPGLGQGIAATTARVLFEQGNDNQYEMYAGATFDSGLALPATFTRKIIRLTWNGASTGFYVNGALIATGNPGGGAGTNWRIGITGGQPLNTLKYFEIVVVAGTPSALEVAAMTSYLSKYNPQ